MKTSTVLSIVTTIAILFCPLHLPAETSGLDETLVTAYLEKKAPGDTGSCLTEGMKLKIIGISDVVPGQQAEVFYTFEYKLRCNRGSESKSGQGVLHAARLRDGSWIDRETFALITK